MACVLLHDSRGFRLIDRQACFFSSASFHPAPSCAKGESSTLVVLPVFSTRWPSLILSRQELTRRKIRGAREAGTFEISSGRWNQAQECVAVAATGSAARKSESKASAVGKEAGDRVDAQLRTAGEEEDRDGCAKEDTRPADESDERDTIASAANAATLAAEASTEELLEMLEDSRGMDRTKLNPEPTAASDKICAFEDPTFLRRAALAENADALLALMAERTSGRGSFLSSDICAKLILAATEQNNAQLAFSILDSMHNNALGFRRPRGGEREEGPRESGPVGGWRWPQADATTYVALVRGLASSLRVSDAIKTVTDMRRRGIPPGDEVLFGKVVSCPTCKTALAVVQQQHGVQLIPCATCRYKYELVSGQIVTSETEFISSNHSFWRRTLQKVPFLGGANPSAIHSVMVRAPDGGARVHRFATESADVPAQIGERVTLVLACPRNAGHGIGPIRFNARTPGWQPSEPMAVTNHVTGKALSLKRAPPKAGTGAAFDFSVLIPAAVILASTDVASGLIDPSFPFLLAVGTASALTLGGAARAFVLPRLNQVQELPQRTAEAVALRQRLLDQYELLHARLEKLTEAASKEVRMLARMCQLQNKMEAVGEASYGARIERVRKAREGLDERIAAGLELMDSFAKVASMIEIEVEIDMDVLAAEAASPEAIIAEQIRNLMEVESLQKEWRNQAEANDEVERLLRSSPSLSDSA